MLRDEGALDQKACGHPADGLASNAGPGASQGQRSGFVAVASYINAFSIFRIVTGKLLQPGQHILALMSHY